MRGRRVLFYIYYFYYFVKPTNGVYMVLVFDGNSEIGAHVRLN